MLFDLPLLLRRGSCFVAALVLLLSATPHLRAQGGEADPGQVEREKTPDEAGEIRTEEGVAAGDNAAGLRETPIHVQVMQDPIRIAPGETGTVLLNVQFGLGNNDASVALGGKAVHESKQGELALGAARFDPPPGGAKRYRRNMLVRIPVSMSAKAKYGKLGVTGTLELPARFTSGRTELGANRDLLEKVTWSGTVVCGPAVPKPVVRKRPKGAAGSGASTSNSSAGSDSAKDERASSGAKDRADADPDAISGAADSSLSGSGSSLDDFGAESGAPGLPSWIFLVVGAMGLVLLFVAMTRKK